MLENGKIDLNHVVDIGALTFEQAFSIMRIRKAIGKRKAHEMRPDQIIEQSDVDTVTNHPVYELSGDQTSIRLDQAPFVTQFRSALMRALASSMSFRMSAVMATLGGFPALIRA